MTQTIPELKNTLDKNAQGAPTEAKSEPHMSNEQAAVEAAHIEENLDSKSAADAAPVETLLGSQDIKPEITKDAARLAAIDEGAMGVGVAETGDHLTAAETMDSLNGTGATVVGETHPATELGKAVGEFNADAKPSGTLIDFDPWKSEKFANTNNNGAALNKAEEQRRGLLRFVPKKLLGGKKAA